MIGYFQSGRYFEKAVFDLRKDFAFAWNTFPEKAKKLREQMQAETSVSLHIRRGDYMNGKFASIYGNICTDAYYEAARRYMKEHFGDCRFTCLRTMPNGEDSRKAKIRCTWMHRKVRAPMWIWRL